MTLINFLRQRNTCPQMTEDPPIHTHTRTFVLKQQNVHLRIKMEKIPVWKNSG